ncbi:tetratricopeptide repeat protein [Pedobacter aquatilis]|uniref:tetratricopeptide repeat protein n=1 Tax=Pedobacter aquatilis TaxID=351343 RepID=UPI00292CB102|nr:tetratricopeptide repeat protein [Pedobacter aquatilis]
MKKLHLFPLFFLFSITVYGQNPASLDKEKLFDFYQTQRYADAANYLKEVYGNDVEEVKILTQIGYCYLMAGNYPLSEQYYLKSYKQQPQHLPTLFSLASINARRGNQEKAKLYYGEIVKIDSNNFNVYKLLANMYTSKDSLKLVYLLKASKLNPLEGDVAYDLSEVYGTRQEQQKAYKVLNIAIAADTGNIILKKAILPYANFLKKYDEVITSGEQILAVDQDALVIKDVAKAYYFTKKYQKAIDKYKLFEEMGLSNEGTLYYTSLCYRALKNYPLAASYTKKTIQEAISPNTSDYYALLGLIYQETNKIDMANSALKKGLEYKASPVILYRLAILYDTKYNKPKQAEKYYKLYLKSKPNPESDKDEIEYVKTRMEQLKTAD